MKKSIHNAPHYKWGINCDGWHLLHSETLSVIQEKMPVGAAEGLHYHSESQQLFYILHGVATFEINGTTHTVNAGESIHIPPQAVHLIRNEGDTDLSFLVVSQPKSHGDRVNL